MSKFLPIIPVIAWLLFAGLCELSAGESWPGWRGPRGDGTSMDTDLPATWNLSEDVIWKTALPGKGHASPIIWGDRIFTVAALEDTRARALLCLDRSSGRILWQKTALVSPLEGIHRLNSHASSTPVTDGERVYVSFLDGDQMFVAAFDFDGNKLWEGRPGVFGSRHGYCSSPILWNEKLIINGDHDGDAYLVALNRATGEILWKTARPNRTRSYCTPIIRRIDGRNQMILSGSRSVTSYDPDTGEQHWIIDGPTEQFVASLVYNDQLDLLFMTCGFPEKHILAIRPGGSGNVTGTHVAWRTTPGASYVPSPVAIGPYFLVVADNGVASCFIAETGERLWRERLPGSGGHSASPITANGLAYFFSDDGVMSVVRPGRDFEVVAQGELGEAVSASPAVYDGKLFLRGDNHLYCIGGNGGNGGSVGEGGE